MPDLFFPVLLGAAFFAAFIQGITGFAFTMIFLAFMQAFLPYTELLAIATVLAIFMLSMNVYVYRHHIVWKWLTLPLVINCLVTVGAIRLLRQTMDFPYWHQLLGIVFILLALYMYIFQQHIQIKPTLKNALLFCGAGGILGGLFGVGLGASRQKLMHLPERHTDFIFSIIGEELGFIGAAFVILLFALFIWRGFYIATHLDDKFKSLTAFGLTAVIGIQAMINIGVAVGFLPVTGITLPFISYGGTSLVFMLATVGFLLNMSRYMK